MWTPRRQSIKAASSGHIETRYAANTVHLAKGPSYVDAVGRLLLRHAIQLRIATTPIHTIVKQSLGWVTYNS
jgi:hypothetical protein